MPSTDDVVIRRGDVHESDEIAELYALVRDQGLSAGAIPPGVHTLEEQRGWVREVLFEHHDVWVAVDGGRIVGFMAMKRPDWLEHLYIDLAHTGSGLGSRFVALAKRELAGPIQLWTFQSNAGARRFYERHGFVAVQWTDDDNEERAPDVRYLYAPGS